MGGLLLLSVAMRTWCGLLGPNKFCMPHSPSPFTLTTLPIRCYSPHLPDGDTETQGDSVTW